MAASGLVRVYLETADGTLEGGPDERAPQHLTDPADDATALRWAGTTRCGVEGPLRRVTIENVDRRHACERCVAVTGTNAALAGDWPGPV